MAAVVGFRSLMAEDAGLPIPDPPHTDLPGRVAKKMATNERAAAPFYRAVAWTALFIGVGLLLASFVAWLFV